VTENDLATTIIGAAIEVHRHLGPGLLESAYEAALSHELQSRRVPHLRQVTLPVFFKGLELPDAYRLDLLVDQTVIVEIKAIDRVVAVHQVQLLTYLRLSKLRLGLLLNFNVRQMRDGVTRLANELPDDTGVIINSNIKVNRQ
jgi:GxxExxY protein